jgi:glycosyltransferase involved in cell wall biosynthesis
MIQDPKISIITPSFNQAKFLRRTIESVLLQGYPNIEYIIIDGDSNDGSQAIIREYESQLAHWESIPDQGQTDAINKGFSKATGKYLAWLNSDDIYHPGALAESVDYLESHPEVGMVYGDCTFIDAADRVIGRFPAAATDYQRLRRGYVHVPQQASFFRADLWQKVGPLDPTFYFAMDYDLWVRLAKEAPLVYLPGHVWASFRLHGEAKTIAADARCWPEMLRVHFREGGHWLSPMGLKYGLRKLAAPIINRRRQRMFRKHQEEMCESPD